MKKNKETTKMGYVLLIIVTFSCFITIIVNYYTVKILSASRAYTTGESQYSKGQKEATALLISYIYSKNITDYNQFLKAINIPIGDRYAREALSSGVDDEQIARAGFLQARNHPDDIPDMIWLFKKFKHLGLFEKAITIWKQADVMVDQLYQQGLHIHNQIDLDKITPEEKSRFMLRINDISGQLTIKQENFSDTIGVICRKLNFGVFIMNALVTILIIGSIILFVWIAIRNIQHSQGRILQQNNSLQAVNAELDKVIYNVSHDLRSPLASLTGLIGLINEEDDLEQIRFFCSLMQESVDKQGSFINDLLLSVKNEQTQIVSQTCDLNEIINDILIQNNYSNEGKKLQYYREILVQTFNCDAVKLKIILNNLISNAVKYSDLQKPDIWIKIKTYSHDSACVIEVEDNGIGIENEVKEKIFERFFSGKQDRNSSGIGLYLTKDAVEQMGGTITVSSAFKMGTKFTVEIPSC